MSKFRLQPHGYYRNEHRFDLWISQNDGEIVVSKNRTNTNIKVECFVITDDYGNGSAEYHISNYNVNKWKCEYMRSFFDWHKSDIFLMVDIGLCPMGISQVIRHSAFETLEELCIFQLTRMLRYSNKILNRCNSNKELATMLYHND